MHPDFIESNDRQQCGDPSWHRKRIPIPRSDGSILIEPPRMEIPKVLRRNTENFRSHEGLRIGGDGLADLRRTCRQEVLDAAVRYTSQWTRMDIRFSDTASPLLMSGHQPQLVHPGAWSKNLLLGHLAEEFDGIGLNLVVDNDLMSEPSLGIPAGSRKSPSIEKVLFDAVRSSQPWEEARVIERDTAASFGKRCDALLARWGWKSSLPSVWRTVEELLPGFDTWGGLLTAARNRFERSIGIENLEIPVSLLSELPCFEKYAVDLLVRLEEFQSVHNRLLSEFRKLYRIRSSTHPVPRLGTRGEFREAPFWVWRGGESNRRPVLVSTDASVRKLTDGRQVLASVERSRDDYEDWKRVLKEAKSQGWKIRPRALSTTLFVRLFLSDIFLHGIGGAHYDEITDRLFTQFYGVPSPEFLIVSAGLYLPLGGFDVSERDEQLFRHELRDIVEVPERHLDSIPVEVERLTSRLDQLNRLPQRKQFLVERRQLYRELMERRARLREDLNVPLQQQTERWEEIRSQLRANRILNSREHSFALFPKELLIEFNQRINNSM